MKVAVCRLHIHLPDATSLKAKRSVLKSLLARLHNTFNVSAAEIEENDRWQVAVIGVALVSNSAPHAQEVISRMLEWIETHFPNIYITDQEVEIL